MVGPKKTLSASEPHLTDLFISSSNQPVRNDRLSHPVTGFCNFAEAAVNTSMHSDDDDERSFIEGVHKGQLDSYNRMLEAQRLQPTAPCKEVVWDFVERFKDWKPPEPFPEYGASLQAVTHSLFEPWSPHNGLMLVTLAAFLACERRTHELQQQFVNLSTLPETSRTRVQGDCLEQQKHTIELHHTLLHTMVFPETSEGQKLLRIMFQLQSDKMRKYLDQREFLSATIDRHKESKLVVPLTEVGR